MSISLMNLITAAGAVGSTVVGGIYANFSLRVMPRLAAMPGEDGLHAMQQFNRVAVQAPFMTFFFGTAAVSITKIVAVFAKHDRTVADGLAFAGAGLYLAGWLLTIAYNVPRNDQLAAVTAGTPEAARVWAMYVNEWTSANTVRGVLSLVGGALLAVGAFLGATGWGCG